MKSENSFYEFHYKCIFENMDDTNWKKDGTDVLKCIVGFHLYETIIDWNTITMAYTPAESDKTKSWKCEDGYSLFLEKGTPYGAAQKDTKYQNCNYIIHEDSGVYLKDELTKRLLSEKD